MGCPHIPHGGCVAAMARRWLSRTVVLRRGRLMGSPHLLSYLLVMRSWTSVAPARVLGMSDSAWWMQYPVISTRSNGDRLVGHAGPFAEDLYAAGTPPAHGLARPQGISPRVADVRIGDRLSVERHKRAWVVSDDDGVLGRLRWRPGDDGRVSEHTGVVIRLPASGVLHVERVLVSPEGKVIDVAGTVYPK